MKCEYEFCEDTQVSRGYCMGHYLQLRRGESLRPKRPKRDRVTPKRYKVHGEQLGPCAVDGCDKKEFARKLCSQHYPPAKNYGLTPEQLAILPNYCEINASHKGQLVYDHDHVTGEYRGRLCSGCNTALGYMESGIREWKPEYRTYIESR